MLFYKPIIINKIKPYTFSLVPKSRVDMKTKQKKTKTL